MDYKINLHEYLISEKNIQFLLENILKNYKIKKTAINKCVDIIKKYIRNNIQKLNQIPKTHDEIMDAIGYINKSSYEDFEKYLKSKYPQLNIVPLIKQETVSESPTNTHLETQATEIIMLSEEEKNQLIMQSQKPKNQMDEILTYLTNPTVLKMFATMINQINISSQMVSRYLNPHQCENKYDAILKSEDVEKLIASYQTEKNADKPVENIPETIPINKKVEIPIEKESMAKDVVFDAPLDKNGEIDDEINLEMDLENISTNDLPKIREHLQKLQNMKKKYLESGQSVIVSKIVAETSRIGELVKNLNKKYSSTAEKYSKKVQSYSISNRKMETTDDNVEYLDLSIDPTNDYNDLKNIIIGFKTENKIEDITLVDYFVPKGVNNITRFNNKFSCYFNNQLKTFNIPPGYYEIDILVSYLKDQIGFLDIIIDSKNIITIKNNMNLPFDLMLGDDTIFAVLGFTGKQSNYKNKNSYIGFEPYNINTNSVLKLELSNSAVDPISLTFDSEVSANISLKHSRAGAAMKQMKIILMDALGQQYDFLEKFKMCFRITYIKKLTAK